MSGANALINKRYRKDNFSLLFEHTARNKKRTLTKNPKLLAPRRHFQSLEL
jgi:hypothetical protein